MSWSVRQKQKEKKIAEVNILCKKNSAEKKLVPGLEEDVERPRITNETGSGLVLGPGLALVTCNIKQN